MSRFDSAPIANNLRGVHCNFDAWDMYIVSILIKLLRIKFKIHPSTILIVQITLKFEEGE